MTLNYHLWELHTFHSSLCGCFRCHCKVMKADETNQIYSLLQYTICILYLYILCLKTSHKNQSGVRSSHWVGRRNDLKLLSSYTYFSCSRKQQLLLQRCHLDTISFIYSNYCCELCKFLSIFKKYESHKIYQYISSVDHPPDRMNVIIINSLFTFMDYQWRNEDVK